MWYQNFSIIIPEFCRASLGCMVSSLVNYVTFLSMKKKLKNKEYEIECASNLVEL